MSHPEVTSFTEIAEFYDDLMKPVPYRMWSSYYLLLLSMQGQKPKTVLDACCGTGTLTHMLTHEGLEVEGFDLSEPMIRQARLKAERRKMPLRFEVANACTVDMGRQYDAALCFFDSFNNITDLQDLLKAFKRIAAHLPSGGSFIFDLNLAYAFEQKMFNQQDMSKSSKVRYRWRGDYDPRTRIIQVNMQFWVGDQEFTETHTQRAYEIEDVVDLLDEAGFQDIRVFESYTLNPPREKSDRVHFASVKK
ncbi:MAG: class I SAM-dependent methyltransferase [Fimbriimonas sp.]|nr:class I SAM-dependent methyltransferase [Fimbriimonas sp.]